MLSLPDPGIWGERGKLTFRSGGTGCVFTPKNQEYASVSIARIFSVCLANKYLSYTTLSC